MSLIFSYLIISHFLLKNTLYFSLLSYKNCLLRLALTNLFSFIIEVLTLFLVL